MQVSYPQDDISPISIRAFSLLRIRTDNRGVPREARCECNDQVEMCG